MTRKEATDFGKEKVKFHEDAATRIVVDSDIVKNEVDRAKHRVHTALANTYREIARLLNDQDAR